MGYADENFMKRPKTFQELVDRVMWLHDQLTGIRLDRKQVQSRYGWSESTLERRIADGTMPKPIRLGGRPLWTLLALSEAEHGGDLPRPVSEQPTPETSSKGEATGQASS